MLLLLGYERIAEFESSREKLSCAGCYFEETDSCFNK
jgi:hypothetical protein